MSKKISFFYKDDCYLCEEMNKDLIKYLKNTKREADIQVDYCDIEAHPHWMDKFKMRIPLLQYQDNTLCEFFFDSESLDRNLFSETNS